MNLFEVGRLAVKIAGRDAGQTCVIVDIKDNFFLIDGQTRRRKCNPKHLEPLNQVIKIKKNAAHAEVEAEFKKLGLTVWETKPKQTAERPRKQRKQKLETKKEEKKKVVVEKPAPTEKPVKEKPKEETKASSFEETLEKETKK